MRVLVACEMSGRVRDAFIERGHDAVSCDILPSETPGPHYQEDVLDIIHRESWDLLIGFPPCTYLSDIGNRWIQEEYREYVGRRQAAAKAIQFFLSLWNAPIEKVCLENPQMHTYARDLLRPHGLETPTQMVHPYYFGDPYTKRTLLWLRGLPKLKKTDWFPKPTRPWVGGGGGPWGRPPTKGYKGLPKEASKLAHPGRGQSRRRSLTHPGMAKAMARQWG